MKLSDYAKQLGISYRTAWRWYKAGKIKGYQAATGTIIVTANDISQPPQKIVIYARVDSDEQLSELARQAERLTHYCIARGYRINQIVKEVAHAHDDRPRLLGLLAASDVALIVVETRGCLADYGFRYIEALLQAQGRRVEVVNLTE